MSPVLELMKRGDHEQSRSPPGARARARPRGRPRSRRARRASGPALACRCGARSATRRARSMIAREAAATAASIAAGATQAPEFRNAPLKVFGRARRRDHRADAQLHGDRQCRRRRHLRRRSPRLRAAGRRRHRLREADQHLRRRLRHRLRQHGGAPRHAVLGDRRPRRPDHPGRGAGRSRSASAAPTSERVEHALFDDADAWRESDMEAYRQKAVTQLGTVGSGNHYVDLMRDEAGFVWIGVHFGSRGLGHTSATRYLKAAGGKDGMNVPPAVIDEDQRARPPLHRGDAACRPLLLCGPRVGGRARAQDHRRQRHRHGAQPPQLRLAREPQRPRSLGRPQGRDAGVSRSAWLRRRLDGRRRRHPRGRRQRGGARVALLDRARRRSPVRPQGGEAALHPRSRWTSGCASAASR